MVAHSCEKYNPSFSTRNGQRISCTPGIPLIASHTRVHCCSRCWMLSLAIHPRTHSRNRQRSARRNTPVPYILPASLNPASVFRKNCSTFRATCLSWQTILKCVWAKTPMLRGALTCAGCLLWLFCGSRAPLASLDPIAVGCEDFGFDLSDFLIQIRLILEERYQPLLDVLHVAHRCVMWYVLLSDSTFREALPRCLRDCLALCEHRPPEGWYIGRAARQERRQNRRGGGSGGGGSPIRPDEK